MSPLRVVASLAEDYLTAGRWELTRLYGDSVRTQRLGPDLLAVDGVTLEDLADACTSGRVVFVRHLTQQVAWLPPEEAQDLSAVEDAAAATVERNVSVSYALQVWSTGRSTVGYRPGEVAARLRKRLGTDLPPGGRPTVVSVCLTPRGVVVGCTPTAMALSDWPGGRIRLARPPEQVSRAEFKLEELFAVAPVRLPTRGRALDLGAAPGGWTRLLRSRGLTVTAVDAGDLAPSVAADHRVHHVRTTTGAYLRRRSGTVFDVLVNDMKMDAETSTALMLEAARALRPGGLAVLTLKITPRRPAEVVRSALGRLRSCYEIEFARQLYHNRNEVTVVARRR